MTKVCSKCGEEKPLDAFYVRSDSGAPRSHCRECLARTDAQRERRRALRSESPERAILSGMVQRCHNQKNPSYPAYGGRGISVCVRWRDSFAAFLQDMGPRPSSAHTIDRINNNGDYEPTNCQWATREVQNRNTRQNVLLTIDGRTQCVSAWATEFGVDVQVVRDRLRLGWDAALAVKTPVRAMRRGIILNGSTMSVAEAARRGGVPVQTVYARLKDGWSPEDACSRPVRGAA